MKHSDQKKLAELRYKQLIRIATSGHIMTAAEKLELASLRLKVSVAPSCATRLRRAQSEK